VNAPFVTLVITLIHDYSRLFTLIISVITLIISVNKRE
jgi:hypothetical protein